MMMTPEQLIELQKISLEKTLHLSQKFFAHVEKAIEINLNITKGTLEDSTEAIKALVSAKDIQELVAVSSSISQPLAEKAVAYGKESYSLASGVISEVSKMVEEQVSDSNRRFVELFETATKNAPAGSEGALALVKSAITAANTTYDSVSKATKQAAEMVEANVEAASKATLKAASAASSQVTKNRKVA